MSPPPAKNNVELRPKLDHRSHDLREAGWDEHKFVCQKKNKVKTDANCILEGGNFIYYATRNLQTFWKIYFSIFTTTGLEMYVWYNFIYLQKTKPRQQFHIHRLNLYKKTKTISREGFQWR